MKLPKAVKKTASIFIKNNFQIFLVGGAVRDYLIKGKIEDFDFATDASPKQVQNLFKHVVPVGIEHGTVLVLFENYEFEVTTFRVDGIYSDARHPDQVHFTKDIHEDLKRRDFTVNAFAYDLKTKKIIDDFNGKSDLKNKTIKAIGSPDERFNEDALRMIRACRFASQLNFSIENYTLESIKKLNRNILNISKERIRDELIKIMKTDMPSIALEYMRETGLMEHILPDLLNCYGAVQNKFHKYDVYYHCLYTCDSAPKEDYRIRLAALLHDIAKPLTSRSKDEDENENSFYNHEIIGAKIAKRILRSLKFKKTDIKDITHLIKFHMFYYTREWTDGAVRRFINNAGVEYIDDLFKLREADRSGNGMKTGIPEIYNTFKMHIGKILEIDNAFKVKDLEINGDILKNELNLNQGPIIGDILNFLLELVLDDQALNKKEVLLEKAKEYYRKKSEYEKLYT